MVLNCVLITRQICAEQFIKRNVYLRGKLYRILIYQKLQISSLTSPPPPLQSSAQKIKSTFPFTYDSLLANYTSFPTHLLAFHKSSLYLKAFWKQARARRTKLRFFGNGKCEEKKKTQNLCSDDWFLFEKRFLSIYTKLLIRMMVKTKTLFLANNFETASRL